VLGEQVAALQLVDEDPQAPLARHAPGAACRRLTSPSAPSSASVLRIVAGERFTGRSWAMLADPIGDASPR
jgi:hypothetical protein